MSSLSRQELLAATASALNAANQILTLRLGAEEYGNDILCVRELHSCEQPTRIADAPPHVSGATNLRGAIVRIVDLRRRFGLPPTTAGRSPCV